MVIDILLALLLSGDLATSAPCLTIAEHIVNRLPEKQAEPLEMFPIFELLIVPFGDVVKAGELAVEGTVTPIRSYLSADGCDVLTDYAVDVSRVYFGALPPAAKPGAHSRVVVTIEGGQVVVNGVQVVVHYQQLPLFKSGEHLMLILAKQSASASSFRLSGGLLGAFAVENQQVKHLLRDASSARFPDMDKTTFIAALKSIR